MYILTKMNLKFSKKKPPTEFKKTEKRIAEIISAMENLEHQHESIFGNTNYSDNDEYVKLEEKLNTLETELYSTEEKEAHVLYDTISHITFVEDETGGIVIDGTTRLKGSFYKLLSRLEEKQLVINIID